MREILFKAKRIDNGEWIEGDLSYHVHDGDVYVFPANGYDSPDCYEVDSETVCEYTGLTDKNGRKIFEGDILKKVLLPTKRIENNFRIAFIPVKSCFSAVDLDGSNVTFVSDYINKNYEIEIIGNIFDNPELLRSTEEAAE